MNSSAFIAHKHCNTAGLAKRVCVVGAHGVGKTTLVDALKKACLKDFEVVSEQARKACLRDQLLLCALHRDPDCVVPVLFLRACTLSYESISEGLQ